MWLKTADGGLLAGGFVARDAEFRTTQSGKSLATFSLKIADKVEDGQRSGVWARCTCWEDLALVAADIVKGDRVLVFGRTQTRTYKGHDGDDKTANELVCDFVQIMARPDSYPAMPDPGYGAAPYEAAADDDLPF